LRSAAPARTRVASTGAHLRVRARQPTRPGSASSALAKRERRLVGTSGLEPLTSCVSSRRSNQLSYAPMRVNVNPPTHRVLSRSSAASRIGSRSARRRRTRRPATPRPRRARGPAVDRFAIGAEIPRVGQPEAAAFGQLRTSAGCRRGRSCARRRAPRACCRAAPPRKLPPGPDVPAVTSSSTGSDRAVPGSARHDLGQPACRAGAVRDRALLDEQARRRNPVLVGPLGRAPDVDARATVAPADVSAAPACAPRPPPRRRTPGCGRSRHRRRRGRSRRRRCLFAHELDLVRFGRVAADDRQRDGDPGAPRSSRVPSYTDISRVERPSIPRM
jgi:hypothetical protein